MPISWKVRGTWAYLQAMKTHAAITVSRGLPWSSFSSDVLYSCLAILLIIFERENLLHELEISWKAVRRFCLEHELWEHEATHCSSRAMPENEWGNIHTIHSTCWQYDLPEPTHSFHRPDSLLLNSSTMFRLGSLKHSGQSKRAARSGTTAPLSLLLLKPMEMVAKMPVACRRWWLQTKIQEISVLDILMKYNIHCCAESIFYHPIWMLGCCHMQTVVCT